MTGGRALDGRVALVTGGPSGLGRAVAEHLVAAGGRVTLCAPDRPDELPTGVHFLAADARDAEAVEAVVATVGAHHGGLDLVVNEVGGSPVADAATAPATASLDVVRRSLLAPLFVAQAANRLMQGQDGGGAIVNLTSFRGVRAAPGTAVDGAAQAGLLHLTRSLAVEWAPKVRVNSVAFDHVDLGPGGDDGPRPPLGRRGTPGDVAAAVAYLASPAAGYVTGTTLVVHGGGTRPAFLAAVAGDGEGPPSA